MDLSMKAFSGWWRTCPRTWPWPHFKSLQPLTKTPCGTRRRTWPACWGVSWKRYVLDFFLRLHRSAVIPEISNIVVGALAFDTDGQGQFALAIISKVSSCIRSGNNFDLTSLLVLLRLQRWIHSISSSSSSPIFTFVSTRPGSSSRRGSRSSFSSPICLASSFYTSLSRLLFESCWLVFFRERDRINVYIKNIYTPLQNTSSYFRRFVGNKRMFRRLWLAAS